MSHAERIDNMKNPNVDIVFFYEHVARELDVACLIAHLLKQQHGLFVEVIQWPYGYHRVAAKGRPKVVVLPFCYNSRSFEQCLLDWREAIFFNMSWEQLFYPGNRVAKSPRGSFARNHVIHHAWSNWFADFLREIGVLNGNIFVNGHPAYALYDKPYHSFFKSRKELASTYGLDPDKKWLFFPENYNWAFYSEETLARFISDGQSPTDVATMREFCRTSLAEVLRWLLKITQVDRFEVIVRPRPATTLEEFKSVILSLSTEGLAGAHICKDETVREWILASDMVVSSHSTSLIEAAIAGKTAYMLEPFPIPAALSVDWHQLVTHLKTEQDFIDACLCQSQVGTPSLEKWVRSSMMAHGDAIQNIVNFLAQLCHGNAPHPPALSRAVALEHRRWPIPGLLFEILKYGRGHRRYAPFRTVSPDLAKDFISQADIEQRIRRWGDFLAINAGHDS